MSTYTKQQPESIQQMFGSIAKRYDRTNAILSFQLHKRWNYELIKLIGTDEKTRSLLDLCSGTGDIALRFLRESSELKEVVFLDFCDQMLEIAKQKAYNEQLVKKHRLQFVTTDAQSLPFADSSFDAITVAYGIRNISNLAACFKEAARVLKKGGRIGILELTRPENPILNFGHQTYLKTLLPLMGRLLTENRDAYRYLSSSIKNFISPKNINQLLTQCGFEPAMIKPLNGGIATILIARKGF